MGFYDFVIHILAAKNYLNQETWLPMYKCSYSKDLYQANELACYISKCSQKKCSCIEHGSQGLDHVNTGSWDTQGEPFAVGWPSVSTCSSSINFFCKANKESILLDNTCFGVMNLRDQQLTSLFPEFPIGTSVTGLF